MQAIAPAAAAITDPASPAGSARREVPGWVRAAAIGALGFGLMLGAALLPAPRDAAATAGTAVAAAAAAAAGTAEAATGWLDLHPGLDAEAAIRRLRRQGFSATPMAEAEGAGWFGAEPLAGPCRKGWAEDRACARAVLDLRRDSEGVARLTRITVERVLPAPVPEARLLAEASRMLGSPPVSSAEEPAAPDQARLMPRRRHLWLVEGPRQGADRRQMQVELVLPSLGAEAVERLSLVVQPAPAPALVALWSGAEERDEAPTPFARMP